MPALEDSLALERQVCFALSIASRTVVSLYRSLLAPMGLTHPQYLVMLALWKYESLSVKALSKMLDLDPGTLSPLLKRLESAGLVSRRRDPSDERLLAVRLTEQGSALRTQAAQIPSAVAGRLQMTVAELDRLHMSLMEIIGAAKSWLESGD